MTSHWTRRAALRLGTSGVAALGAGVVISGLPTTASAQGLRKLEVLSFPGAYNIVLFAGNAKGIYQKHGIEMVRSAPRNSGEFVESLLVNKHQIGIATIDNAVAYMEGQGEAKTTRPSDLFGFMGLEPAIQMPVIVESNINTVADLKGKKLCVDAITTGFAFVLRKVIESKGLAPTDYELVTAGNAGARLEALKAGKCNGSLLTPPFNRMAMADGYKEIGRGSDVFAEYQGPCFLASRQWAAQNSNLLIDFIKATVEAIKWVKDPANEAEAAKIYMANTPDTAEQAEDRHFARDEHGRREVGAGTAQRIRPAAEKPDRPRPLC
jgi:ABC-type nitrate/sulfonate/bicarbonate transport system substrate-binding protein